MNKLALILASTFAMISFSFYGCATTMPSLPSTPSTSSSPVPELQPSSPENTTEPSSEHEPDISPPIISISEPVPIPINIRIDYIGIENAYGGNVQLVVVASDGVIIEKYSIPSGDESYTMHNFEVKEINRRVFHTADLKGDLKLNILAYHRDQQKNTNLELINMMDWYYGDGINVLKNIVVNMPENDKLIGEYEQTWYLNEPITTEQKYETVGDLHVWFSIWSDAELEVIAKPPFEPDVKILDVVLPSNAKKSTPVMGSYAFVNEYPTTLRLQNNEGVDITVDVVIEGQGYSPDIIAFTGGDVLIPEYGHNDITTKYYYKSEGTRQITYTISHNGVKLDSWSGTLNVMP